MIEDFCHLLGSDDKNVTDVMISITKSTKKIVFGEEFSLQTWVCTNAYFIEVWYAWNMIATMSLHMNDAWQSRC